MYICKSFKIKTGNPINLNAASRNTYIVQYSTIQTCRKFNTWLTKWSRWGSLLFELQIANARKTTEKYIAQLCVTVEI